MKKYFYVLFVSSFFCLSAFAQQGMGVGNNNPLEMLHVTGAIKIGSDINNGAGAPAGGAGTMRFKSAQFEGWNGSTWVPLGGGTSGSFATTSNVTSNSPGTLATDDFVFGSATLANVAGTNDDARMFFDKSKGAFRAGTVDGTQWDDANVGTASTALGINNTAPTFSSTAIGQNNTASGTASVAMGQSNTASTFCSTAIGQNNTASGTASVAMGQSSTATNAYAISLGQSNTASGTASVAMGQSSTATNAYAVAMGQSSNASGLAAVAMGQGITASGVVSTGFGSSNTASGNYSYVSGIGNFARSYAETTIGAFATDYTPNSATAFNAADRLFVVGNGAYGAESNALTLYKNGVLNINDAYNLPSADGTANYVMKTNGSGVASWADPNTLVTNDGDWTISGVNMYSGVSGNVGIGTTTPQQKLTLSADSDPVFRIDRSGSGAWDWEMYATSGGRLTFRGGSDNVGALLTDRLTILGDGNVGIGTTAPDAKLNVNGTSHFQGVSYFQANVGVGTSSPQQHLTISHASDPVLRMDRSSASAWDWEMYATSGGSLRFRGGSDNVGGSLTDRLTVQGDGNVGIGTTTPDRQLNIESATGPRMLFTRDDGTTTDGELMGEILFDNNDDTAPSSVDAAVVIRAIASGNQGNSNKGGHLSFLTKNNSDGAAAATERMRIAANGNVGIFSSNSLKFYDDAGTTIRGTIGQYAANSDMVVASNVNNAWLRIGANNSNIAFMPDNTYSGGSNPAVVISANKRMGIGTTVPIAPLHVEAQTTAGNEASYGNFWYYAGGGYASGACCGGNVTGVSIHASGRVMAGEFDAFSDERIKNIMGVSSTEEDLQTLLSIQITDYKMKDALKGDKPYKKVIAQQVETVYPQATSTITDVVPDIYTMASISDGIIDIAIDLKVGDKVKLIFEDGDEMAEVVSVAKGSFKVNSEKSGDVFVYGREVSDFHVVDYEAISMLNVSATQELYKLIQQLQKENSTLKAELKGFASLLSDVERLKEAVGIDLQSSK